MSVCSAAVRPEYSLGIRPSWTNWRCSMMSLNQSVGDSQPVGGQGVQMVAAGNEASQGAGQRDVQRVGHCLPAAQVHHGAEVPVLVGLAGAVAEGGGEVAGDSLALALRVLGGHGCELPGTGEVRGRGRV